MMNTPSAPIRRFVPLLALTLAACAAPAPDRVTVQPIPPSLVAAGPGAPTEEAGPAARSLYALEMAELALERGRPEVGAEQLVVSAELSGDRSIARRATLLAADQDRPALLLRAAQAWRSNAPDELLVERYLLEAHLGLGQRRRAAAAMDHLIAGGVDDAGMGWAEVVATVSGFQPEARSLGLDILHDRIDRTPAHPASLPLARLQLQEGDRPAARRLLERLVEAGEGGEALRLLARMTTEDGEPDAALALLAGAEDPESARYRGQLLAQLGRLDEAAAEFDALLDVSPRDPAVAYAAALVAMEQDRLGRAEDLLLPLLGEPRYSAHVALVLGEVFRLQDDHARALSAFGLIQGGELALDARIGELQVLSETGQTGQALDRLEGLREAHPDAGDRLMRVEVDLLMTAWRGDEAVALLDRIIEADGETDGLLYSRALAASIAGDLARASQDFEALLERDPDDAVVLNAYGYLLADLDTDLDRAEEMLAAALAAEPGSPAVLDSMGWLRYRQGDLDAALDLLTEAWILESDPEIGAHLGEVLWEKGERTRARSVWATARLTGRANPVLEDTTRRLDPEPGEGR